MMAAMTTAVANVLWTSGWDSTYRVADLLLNQGRAVQPWYVLDESRRSTKRELATLDRIREALIAKDPNVADRLAPVISRRRAEIPADPAITAKFRSLASRSHLGSQYDWLARFARAEDVTLELCIHRDDKAHAFLVADVEATDDGSYRLRKNPSDPALSIFERYLFPVFDVTKPQMQERAEAGGFRDVMEMTWFCFGPLLDGRPCGYCNPCRYTREEGLGRRVPRQTPIRGLQYHVLRRAWSVRRRLANG